MNSIRQYLNEDAPTLSRKEKLIFILATGLFVFLFLLFFQPFGVNNYNPKETITIQFLLMMFFMGLVVSTVIAFNEFILFSLFFKNATRAKMVMWIIWSVVWLSSAVFLFYNYMGNWHDMRWSSYFGFIGNMSIVSILPFSGIYIYIQIRELRISLEAHAFSYEVSNDDLLIVFQADNLKDQFTVPLKYVVYLESEDNYISIYHLKQSVLTKTLIRKSLKSVQEEQLNPALIRCHRSFMINLIHLQKVYGNRNKLEVFLDHLEHPIPVSRQYIDSVYKLVS